VGLKVAPAMLQLDASVHSLLQMEEEDADGPSPYSDPSAFGAPSSYGSYGMTAPSSFGAPSSYGNYGMTASYDMSKFAAPSSYGS